MTNQMSSVGGTAVHRHRAAGLGSSDGARRALCERQRTPVFFAPPIPVTRPARITFPPAARRTEGSRPPLQLSLISDQVPVADLAHGRAVEPDWQGLVSAVRAARDCSIVLDIDCAGGSCSRASALAFALLAHQHAVRVRITGRCASSAAIVALGGDHRAIAPDATVLLHRPIYILTLEQWDEIRRGPRAFRLQLAAELEQIEEVDVALLVARTGQSVQTVRTWMLNFYRAWSAEEAVANGLAHEIDPTITRH